MRPHWESLCVPCSKAKLDTVSVTMEVEEIKENEVLESSTNLALNDTFAHLRYTLPMDSLPAWEDLQDGNSNYSSQPQSECNFNNNNFLDIEKEKEREEAAREYQKFLQSLAIPVDQQSDNEEDDDPDFSIVIPDDINNDDPDENDAEIARDLDENVQCLSIQPLPNTSPDISPIPSTVKSSFCVSTPNVLKCLLTASQAPLAVIPIFLWS